MRNLIVGIFLGIALMTLSFKLWLDQPAQARVNYALKDPQSYPSIMRASSEPRWDALALRRNIEFSDDDVLHFNLFKPVLTMKTQDIEKICLDYDRHDKFLEVTLQPTDEFAGRLKDLATIGVQENRQSPIINAYVRNSWLMGSYGAIDYSLKDWDEDLEYGHTPSKLSLLSYSFPPDYLQFAREFLIQWGQTAPIELCDRATNAGEEILALLEANGFRTEYWGKVESQIKAAIKHVRDTQASD
jgi:hypothetical protein